MPAPALKLNKLFNAYNTTIRMLQDRGCVILGPQPVVEALATNPTGPSPVSLALLKKMCRPDAEETKLSGITINRAALTITCTLSSYVLQLTNTVEMNANAPLMQVAFVEESGQMSMNTANDLRDSARNAGAQWLIIVADCKVPNAVRKEIDELNVGWGLLTTSNASSSSSVSKANKGSNNNGIITDIVEKTVPGIDIPAAGAKPRRALKKSTVAATDASSVAMANAFLDENQPLTAIATATKAPASTDDDSDADNANDKKKEKKKKSEKGSNLPRPLFVELFEEDDLVFSPFRHSLAPKHRVLSEVEVEQLLREKGATLPQLPRMEFSDPVSRHFGLQRGAVVHITRAPHSDVVGEHSMYRHVV